jgi:hypothetical protein
MESILMYVISSKVDDQKSEEISVNAGNTYAKKIGASFH